MAAVAVVDLDNPAFVLHQIFQRGPPRLYKITNIMPAAK
jgi:hypothetical protein